MMDISEGEAWARGYMGGPPTIKWFISECGDVYDYDVEEQQDDFPNDPPTAYDTEEEAWEASLAMWPEPSCDDCGILMEDTAYWCGECGNCRYHCLEESTCPDWKSLGF